VEFWWTPELKATDGRTLNAVESMIIVEMGLASEVSKMLEEDAYYISKQILNVHRLIPFIIRV